MSVSQVKKAIEDMAAYLGRDAQGLEKLRRIKESVNVLRNNLAASTESEASAVSRMSIAIDESVKVRGELEASRIEIHRLRQRIDNLTMDSARPAVPPVPVDESQGQSDGDESGGYKSAIKELRTHMRRCPRAISYNRRASTTGLIFTRESLAEGWSHRALWVLGASVAILAAYKGEVTIMSGDEINNLEPYDDDDMTKKCHQFLRWFANNIDWSHDAISSAVRDTKVDAQKTKGYLYK